MRSIFNLLVILIMGGLGGVLANQVVLPYLAHTSPFEKIDWIRRAGTSTTIINKIERVIITENTALQEAINRINSSVVGIIVQKTGLVKAQTLTQGTGFILTSDGLVVTAANLVSVLGADKYLVMRNEQLMEAQVIKRDFKNNLALLKIQETNLPPVSLGEISALRLGERLVLVGFDFETKGKFVNSVIIKRLNLSEGKFEINLFQEDLLANGSALINIKGDVVGLNLIDSKNNLSLVSVNKIKELIQQ